DMWQGLDRESAWALGEVYANRPQTAEELFRYLTGMDPDLEFGPSVTSSAVHGGDGADTLGHPAPAEGTGNSSEAGVGPGLEPIPGPVSHPADPAATPAPAAGPVPEPRPESVPAPTGVPVAATMATAQLQASTEDVAYQRTAALIDRLLDAGDTDALTRLAACESLRDLDRLEAELNGVTAPQPPAAPIARVGMPAAPPVTATSTATSSAAPRMGGGRVAPVMPTLTLVEDRPSRIERIAQAVDNAGPTGITRAEVIAALIEGGDEATAPSFEQQVTNALRQLVQRQTIARTGRGYVSARHHQTRQHTPERNTQ
ncbi:MAG: hypothetical protein ABW224_13650, partial [Kibdelosporangium sp.]